jgi:anti-sigma factor RsiW
MKERTVAGIRCSEVLERLTEYVDGELDATGAKKIENHLLGCPNCERFGRNFGAMVVSLRQESEQNETVQLDVMTRLLSELRQMGNQS